MELFNLQAKITLDSKEYEEGLNNAEDKIKQTEDEVDKRSSGIGKKLLGAAKVIGAGMTTIAGGITAVTKKSVDAFAEYEQLTGGVETLFKDSADIVKNYADEAYKTAGLSANQYMTTVTSFSASLLQGLNGDTKKAADVANTAITDMSDNANKMGTSMEDIQNAYQGFAKQNYTMLDNLKLGYGGTKEEMQRLLEDAEKMPEAMGRKFNLENYADVIEAIHVVQKNMGISGYSVDELNEKLKSQTLSQEEVKKVAKDMGISYAEAMQKMKDGSLTAKDAQALLGTTAKEAATTVEGSANMTKAAWQNMITALGTGDLDKVTKTAQQLGDSLVLYLQNLIPVIESAFTALPSALDPVIQMIGDKLPELIDKVVPAFIQLVGSLGSIVADAIPQLVEILVENLPLLIEAGVQIVTSLISGIGEAMPTLIPTAIDAILTIVQGLLDNIPMLVEAAVTLIVGLAEGLINALPILLEMAPQIIESLVSALIGASEMLVSAALQIIMVLVAGIIDNLPQIVQAAIEIVTSLVSGIIGSFPQVVRAAGALIKTFWNTLGSVKWGELGTNIIKGIAKGISNAKKIIVTAVKEAASGALKAVKALLGIHSPSTVFRDQVGKNMALGLAEGFEDNIPDFESALAFDYNIPEYETSYKVDMPENTVDANTRLYSMLNEFFPVLLDAIGEQKEISIDGRKVINYVDSELGKKYAQKARGN